MCFPVATRPFLKGGGIVVFRRVVRYYLARLLSGEFVRSSEHDDATWASSDAAIEMLQHENARALVVAADNFLGLEAS